MRPRAVGLFNDGCQLPTPHPPDGGQTDRQVWRSQGGGGGVLHRFSPPRRSTGVKYKMVTDGLIPMLTQVGGRIYYKGYCVAD